MIEKLCNNLTKRIQNKMPDIDEERAEIINYGLQLIFGEFPKTIILILIAYIFGVLKLSLLSLIFIMPYRVFSGGVHLKTHIGCVIATSIFYIGNAVLSKNIIITPIYLKNIIIILIWIFSMYMIKLYAPADTIAVPILRKKDRRIKKILSYVTMSMTLIITLFIKDSTISNLLIFGTLFQTISITRLIYRITNNKYGYEEYLKENNKLKDMA